MVKILEVKSVFITQADSIKFGTRFVRRARYPSRQPVTVATIDSHVQSRKAENCRPVTVGPRARRTLPRPDGTSTRFVCVPGDGSPQADPGPGCWSSASSRHNSRGRFRSPSAPGQGWQTVLRPCRAPDLPSSATPARRRSNWRRPGRPEPAFRPTSAPARRRAGPPNGAW